MNYQQLNNRLALWLRGAIFKLGSALYRMARFFLGAAIMLSLIWYEPFRTAPVELQVKCLALIAVAIYFAFANYRDRFSGPTQFLMAQAIILAVTMSVLGPLFWYFGPMADLSNEIKMSALVFLVSVAWWFILDHRTEDKCAHDPTGIYEIRFQKSTKK